MNKETEITTVKITRYYDSKGNPTCARNFEVGDICVFYRTQRFGSYETCVFAENGNSGYNYPLLRRKALDEKDDFGSLIPNEKWCPVWKDTLNNPLYTFQRVRKNAPPFGQVHGAENDQETLCGLKINSNWIILTNNHDGTMTCTGCRKIHAEVKS